MSGPFQPMLLLCGCYMPKSVQSVLYGVAMKLSEWFYCVT